MEEFIIKTKAELDKFLKKEIDANKEGLVCFQSGHFPLIHDEKNNVSVPAIFEEIEDEDQKNAVKNHPYMGYFPLATWKEGVSLLKYGIEKNKNCKQIILVNDWQWVKKAEDGQENLQKEKFYKEEKLPKLYFEELKNNGLGVNIFLPFRNEEGNIQNKFFFSEQRLRNRYKRYYATTCPLNNQCAQEYLPLLLRLEDEGVKLFISFCPRTCILPVNAATESFIREYNSGRMKIINIFTDGIFNKNFWENSDIFIWE